MRRYGATLWWLLVLLVAGQTGAVTLGEVNRTSRVGEPLEIAIDLSWSEGESIETLRVELAPRSLYEEQGLIWLPLYDTLDYSIQQSTSGRGELLLYSDQRTDARLLPLLLQMEWKQGSLWQRVDAIFGESLAKQPVSDGGDGEVNGEVESGTADPAAAQEPSSSVQTGQYGPVGSESLDKIAVKLSKGRPRGYLHMMYQLYLDNPHAFYRDNMNNLRSGVMLDIPSDESLLALSDAETFAAIKEQYRIWKLERSERSASTEAGAMLEQFDVADLDDIDLSAGPQALEGHLKGLLARNRRLEASNAELRRKLDKLEADVARMTDNLLADPAVVAAKERAAQMEESERVAEQPPQDGSATPAADAKSTAVAENHSEQSEEPGESEAEPVQSAEKPVATPVGESPEPEAGADSPTDGGDDALPSWWWLLPPLPFIGFILYRRSSERRGTV